MHILCPHCHNPIELVKIDPRAEISCPSCGSSFHLEGEPTTGWERQAGQRLGKFELIEPVGQGGCGTVYKARDPELDRVVAIKVPRAGNLAGPQELDRFLREARSVARLRHPAIVPVHEVGEQDGVPYLVSDFVHGVTLADLLSARRPGFREAAELIAVIADALQYAHDHGVIHRDVKPSNVMIGEGGAAFVMDFGLAKRDAGEITMTVEGQVLGTPAYMPPEQARGEGHAVDARGDVYSLGVVLYQLLTGELPFRGTQRMLLHQVFHDEPRRPRSLNEHIPRDLETVCLKAMAKEPGRRYASAREFADDLRHWLKGEPIRARPAGRAERAVRWARRHPAPAALVAVSGLALLAVVGLGVGLAYNARLDEQRKDAEAARDQANIAKKTAEEARDQAEIAKQGEAKQRQRAEEIGYFHSISLADLALKENILPLAQRHLKECKAEQRNWEWRYLQAQCHPELFSIPGQSAAFSPDGTRIAVEGGNGMVRVYDLRTNQEAFGLKGPALFGSAVFSPDGTRLAVGLQGGEVRVYDGRTGKEVFTLKGLESFRSAVFSRDGARIEVKDRGLVRVYDSRTGKEEFTLKGLAPFRSAVFSPDGTRIVVEYRGLVRVYDGRTGKEAFTLKGLESFRSAVFSPDGTRIVIMGENEMVRGYDPRTGQEVFSFKCPAAEPFPMNSPRLEILCNLMYSPDSLRLVIRGSDGVVRVYDGRTGQEKLALQGRDKNSRIAFSPDGIRIVARNQRDGVMRVYDIRTGQVILTFKGLSDKAPFPVFSPDGTRLADVGDDRALRVFDFLTGQAFTLKGPCFPDNLSVFSPDGTRIAVRENDGMVRVYDVRTGPEALVLKGPVKFLRPALSPDGTRIVTAGIDEVVRVYDARTGLETLTIRGSGKIPTPVFSPDGSRIAVMNSGGMVRVYDARTGRDTLAFQGPAWPNYYTDVVFSPDGERLMIRGGDGRVRVYDGRTGREAFALEGPAGHRYPTFSPDGTLIAASGGGVLRVYDARTGKKTHDLQGPAPFRSAAFSPDGSHIAVTDSGGVVRVYEARTGREAFAFQGPAGPIKIMDAVFSPDGARLVIRGDSDGMVRVYDARTGQEAFALQEPDRAVNSLLAFSPDGARLAIRGDRDGVAMRVYDARTGQEIFSLKGSVSLDTRPVFSRDGTRIAALADGVIQVWTAPNDVAVWQAERRQSLADSAPAWHRTQAAEHELDGDWFRAAFHWGWLAQAEPDRGQPHFRRGLALAHLGRAAEAKIAFETALAAKKDLDDFEQAAAHAELGQWDAVRTLYAQAVAAPNASPLDLAAHGVARLERGDRTGYTAACETLLDRFGKTGDPSIANEVAWACAIGPAALPDLKPAVELARRAVRANPKDFDARNTFGAILVRAGQHDEAVRELNRAIQLNVKGGTGWDFVFLALAQYQLGQPDAARKWLDRAFRVAAWERALNDTQRLELNLLRREAAALLKGPAPPPPPTGNELSQVGSR